MFSRSLCITCLSMLMLVGNFACALVVSTAVKVFLRPGLILWCSLRSDNIDVLGWSSSFARLMKCLMMTVYFSVCP